jgi:hypothetical protein
LGVARLKEYIMHVHQNPINPNAQLDAMYAAQKAAAKREAERTRKKLSEFASEIAGEAEADACIVELREGEQSEDAREPPDRQRARDQRGQDEKDSGNTESSISDWA